MSNDKKIEVTPELIEEMRHVPHNPWKESHILMLFKMLVQTEHFKNSEPNLPISMNDTIVYEMSLKYGRADIVIFHIDGSVSVIEVKDGSKGYNHIVAGLGQVGLYAFQLAMRKDIVKRVRKCLLWTSTGDLWLDTLITEVCEQSNTVPMQWGHINEHMARHLAVHRTYKREEDVQAA